MKKHKEYPWSDKAAGRIARAGVKLQSKFSDFMNKLFDGMNAKKIKTFLIVFCLSCGGYSIYLITNSIFNDTYKQPTIKIDRVDVPKHFDKTGDEITEPENYVDEETYLKIQEFKQSEIYDSIMKIRPGLSDSIRMLEEIYNSQKIK